MLMFGACAFVNFVKVCVIVLHLCMSVCVNDFLLCVLF